MITIKGIKAACKWLNHADREVSARNNLFYDTKTNELLAEVKLKDENGNKYQSMKHIIDRCVGWREEDYDGYNDYYVNPEYHRSEHTRKIVEQQKESEYENS